MSQLYQTIVRRIFLHSWLFSLIQEKHAWLNRIIRWAGLPAKPGLPRIVRLESTNGCNLHCVFCPRDKHTRKIGVMSMETFAHAIDQCREMGVEQLTLQGFGEPLLDPNIANKIKYAKKQGIPLVVMITNGTKCDETMIQGLMEAGLDRMRISLDAATAETYEHKRIGFSYSQLEHNILSSLKARNEAGLKNPRIEVIFVKGKDNAHEAEAFREKWTGVADRILFHDEHNWAGKIGQANEALAPCRRLWESMTVLWNGDVSLCCQDVNGEVILGNINEQSLAEIFTGERFRQVREAHLLYPRVGPASLCANCSLPASDPVEWVKRLLRR